MKLRILFASDFSKWSNPELAMSLSKLLGTSNPDKIIDLRKIDKDSLTKLGYDKDSSKDTLKGIYNYLKSKSDSGDIPDEWIQLLKGGKKAEVKKDPNKVTILTDHWSKDGSDYTTGFSEGVIGTQWYKDVGYKYKETKFINDKLKNIYPCGDGTIKYRDWNTGASIDVIIKDDKGKDHFSQLYWRENSDNDAISIKVDNPITKAKIPFKETDHKHGSGRSEFVKLLDKFLKSAVGNK